MESQNSKGKGNRKSRSKKNAVFHYTNSEGLIGIIKSNRLWSTAKHCTNDSSEFKYALGTVMYELIFHEISSKFKNKKDCAITASNLSGKLTNLLLDGLFEKFLNFITCFTAVSDKDKEEDKLKNSYDNGVLSQWRGYGKDGGYAIEFYKKEIAEACKTTAQGVLDKISYGSTSRNIYAGVLREKFLAPLIESFDSLDQLKAFTGKLSIHNVEGLDKDMIIPMWKMVAFTKNPHFKEENEYRILNLSNALDCKFYSRNGFIIPYVELNFDINPFISRIIVGPSQRIDGRVESVKMLLKSENLDLDIEVTRSAIPFEKG